MKKLLHKITRVRRWIYHRWFWVQDWTKDLSVWFDKENNIVPVDYKGATSDTAHPKNWKEARKILTAMEKHGCKHITIDIFTSLLGKRRWDTEYEYTFNTNYDKEIT